MNEMTRRWLELLIEDCGAIDVRVDTGKGHIGAWCDNVDSAITIATDNSDRNIYTSINRPGSAVVTNAIASGDRMNNKLVTEYRRLFFDFDPVRQVDQPSTDAELGMARDRANALGRYLRSEGFPDPAYGVSGNGVHLMYRCAYKNTDEFRKYYKALFLQLSEQFSDDAVDMDLKVRNPGRLTRFYGTYNRKGHIGTLAPDRPHRQSSIWVPRDYRVVPAKTLWALIRKLGLDIRKPVPSVSGHTKTSGKGDYSTLDVVSWFRVHGLYGSHVDGNVHAVTCPWAGSHSSSGGPGETIVYEADGSWPGFFCHHSHCEGRGIRDVMEVLGDADAFCRGDFRRAN